MGELAILVPVLKRPHRVRPLLDSIRHATPDARVLFIPDPGDRAEREAIEQAGAEELPMSGGYAAKCNAAVQATREPYVLLGADDIAPQLGWFGAALSHVRQGAHVVGLNDLRPRNFETATHFLLTREYCAQPAIDGGQGPCHEGYSHNFVDRELIETAQRRGVYAYARHAIVEHYHHLDGRAEFDETYAAGQATFRLDARLFRRRARLWAT